MTVKLITIPMMTLYIQQLFAAAKDAAASSSQIGRPNDASHPATPSSYPYPHSTRKELASYKPVSESVLQSIANIKNKALVISEKDLALYEKSIESSLEMVQPYMALQFY